MERWYRRVILHTWPHVCGREMSLDHLVLIWFYLMLVASADAEVLHRCYSRFFEGGIELCLLPFSFHPSTENPSVKDKWVSFGLASGPGLYPPLLMGYHFTQPSGCLDNPITPLSCYSFSAFVWCHWNRWSMFTSCESSGGLDWGCLNCHFCTQHDTL